MCGGPGGDAAVEDDEDYAPECAAWCTEWTCDQPDYCAGCTPCLASPPPPPLLPNAFVQNPFRAQGGWYVHPSLRQNLEETIPTATPSEAETLRQMAKVPSAFWIDNKAKIHGNDLTTLEGILKDAEAKPIPPMCVFIFYDLPNRDCNAQASRGEINAAAAGSEAALTEYKREYVDPFAEMLAAHASVPVALVIEPDSLGNVISNEGKNGCSAATVANYKEGVRYAIATLRNKASHVAIYVDAAHGGW